MGKFNKNRGFSSRDSRGSFSDDRSSNRSFGNMHKAVCDECGKSCEVPFKPSGDKPIYCNECFSKRKTEGNRGSRKTNDGGENKNLLNQLVILNSKMDKLIDILTSTKKEVRSEISEPKKLDLELNESIKETKTKKNAKKEPKNTSSQKTKKKTKK